MEREPSHFETWSIANSNIELSASLTSRPRDLHPDEVPICAGFAVPLDMLSRIAVISPHSSDLEKVRVALRNPLRYTVREFLSMEAVAKELKLFPMELMVLRYASFDERQVAAVTVARRLFRNVGLVLMAKEIAPAARAKVGGIERLRLLDESLEATDLASVVEKLLRGDSTGARLHPRVRRDCNAQIIDESGTTFRAQFIDFAQMGARVSFQGIKTFKPRQSVQLIYTSSQTGKSQRLETKVVWTAIVGSVVEQLMGVKSQTVGLRFIASY